MARVIGIDPGTVSFDVVGLVDGALALDRSWPAGEVASDPVGFLRSLEEWGRPDLVAGPSGYGLPLVRANDLTDVDLSLAFLAPPGEAGGIGGLRRLASLLVEAGWPTVFLPGVIHLDTVPAHRKLNRVDLGTADKVCAAALAIEWQSRRLRVPLDKTSFILLELGGAFSAALAVDGGRIVDGLGGTSGPIGWRSSGAWDGEVAYLAGEVTKQMLFQGGVESVRNNAGAGGEALAREALIEGAVKAVRWLGCSVPRPREILLSGRHAADRGVGDAIAERVRELAPAVVLSGYADVAKAGAQGAALLADGLAGGRFAPLVQCMRLRGASGTVLDHLRVIDVARARARLGLA